MLDASTAAWSIVLSDDDPLLEPHVRLLRDIVLRHGLPLQITGLADPQPVRCAGVVTLH